MSETRISIEWESTGADKVQSSFEALQQSKEKLLENFKRLNEVVSQTAGYFNVVSQAIKSTPMVEASITSERFSASVTAVGDSVKQASTAAGGLTQRLANVAEGMEGVSKAGQRGADILNSFAFTAWVAGITFRRLSAMAKSFLTDIQKVGEAAERTSLMIGAMVPLATVERTRAAFTELGATQFISQTQIESTAILTQRLEAMGVSFQQVSPYVVNLGLALGNTSKAFELFASYVETGNKALFNSIGVLMTEEKEREALAEITGKNVEQLSAYELHVARATLATREMIPVLTTLSDYLSRNVSLIDASRARLEEASKAAYDRFAPSIALMNEMTASLIQGFVSLDQATGGVMRALISTVSVFGMLTSAFLLIISLAGPIKAALTAIGVSLSAVLGPIALISLLVGALIAVGTAAYEASQKLAMARQQLEEAGRAANELVTSLAAMTGALSATEAGSISTSLQLQVLKSTVESLKIKADEAALAFQNLFAKITTWVSVGVSAFNKLNSIARESENLVKRRNALEERQAKLSLRLKQLDLSQAKATNRLNKAQESLRETEADAIDLALKQLRRQEALERATWNLYKAEYELKKLREDAGRKARDLEIAQNNLEVAIRKYGESSWEAWEASRNLLEMQKRLEEANFALREGEEKRTLASYDLQEAQLEMLKPLQEVARAVEDASIRMMEASMQLSIYEDQRIAILEELNEILSEIIAIGEEKAAKDAEYAQQLAFVTELYGEQYQVIESQVLPMMQKLKTQVDLGIITQEEYEKRVLALGEQFGLTAENAGYFGQYLETLKQRYSEAETAQKNLSDATREYQNIMRLMAREAVERIMDIVNATPALKQALGENYELLNKIIARFLDPNFRISEATLDSILRAEDAMRRLADAAREASEVISRMTPPPTPREVLPPGPPGTYPEYPYPGYQYGGGVARTGLYYLHAGETVLTARQTEALIRAVRTPPATEQYTAVFTINLSVQGFPRSVSEIRWLANRLEEVMSVKMREKRGVFKW